MNVIKSLFFAVMSLGLVGTTSVARAEQPAAPAEEGIAAEAACALSETAATDEGTTAESEEALSSQDWEPFDFGRYSGRGGRRRCREFCADEYRDCIRFGDRWRRRGYDRDNFRRRNRCERELNFCVRRFCDRRGPF
ncbi:MAG TPA: hypothetical protein VM694_23960 [Polyangium sp.]|nr:hypothetical protein [Polyangium sp.]